MPKRVKATPPPAAPPAAQPVTVTRVPTAICAECGQEMIPTMLSGHYEREHPIAVEKALAASR